MNPCTVLFVGLIVGLTDQFEIFFFGFGYDWVFTELGRWAIILIPSLGGTFIRPYRSLDRFAPNRPLRPWLLSSA